MSRADTVHSRAQQLVAVPVDKTPGDEASITNNGVMRRDAVSDR